METDRHRLEGLPGAGAVVHRTERRPLAHYLLVRDAGGDRELFQVPLSSRERALAAFSSGSAAWSFAFLGLPGRGWYAEERSAGEMATLLLALRALPTEVGWVLFDPLPGRPAAWDVPANLMRRDDFLDYLLG